jgi:hypothetical protein
VVNIENNYKIRDKKLKGKKIRIGWGWKVV